MHPDHTVKSLSVLSLRSRVSYRGGGGGRGGFIPLMILARGGYPPHQTAEQCFFVMGILVKSFKKVFRRQIPFFSKFVFSNCPPNKFFSGGNPA